MRTFLLLLAGLIACAPAQAQTWSLRKFPEAGFGIESPVPLTRGEGTYKAAVAGAHKTVVYSGMYEGVKYSVSILDISNRIPEAVNLFEEAEFVLSETGKVVVNEGLGVEPGPLRQYGRELVIDRPDGSRTYTSLMYQNGKIYFAEALIAKGGDFDAIGPQRFADSILFALEGPLRERDAKR